MQRSEEAKDTHGVAQGNYLQQLWINSQSLEDTHVGYISHKYTLDKYTLEKYTLKKYTLEWVADQLTGGEGPPRIKIRK